MKKLLDMLSRVALTCKKYTRLIGIIVGIGILGSGTFWLGRESGKAHVVGSSDVDDIDMLLDRKLSSTTEKIARRLAKEFRDVLDDIEFEVTDQAELNTRDEMSEVDQLIKNEVKRQMRGRSD